MVSRFFGKVAFVSRYIFVSSLISGKNSFKNSACNSGSPPVKETE